MTTSLFPAAPLPRSSRTVIAVAVVAVATLGAWLWWTARGTGVDDLLLVVGLMFVAPGLWHLAMTPRAYSIEGRVVRVHRRLLPDSRFPVRGEAERYTASFRDRRAAPEPERQVSADEMLLGRRRTMGRERGRRLHALTDLAKGVRVQIRGGVLVISPDDPEGFLEALSSARR